MPLGAAESGCLSGLGCTGRTNGPAGSSEWPWPATKASADRSHTHRQVSHVVPLTCCRPAPAARHHWGYPL